MKIGAHLARGVADLCRLTAEQRVVSSTTAKGICGLHERLLP